MTAQDMLARATQGNPQAIAVILNHFTEPKGIKVNVTREQNVLQVVFSAERLPNQAVMTAFVRRSVEQLNINGVDVVRVIGQRTGNEPTQWLAEISLERKMDENGLASVSAAIDLGALNIGGGTDSCKNLRLLELLTERGVQGQGSNQS